MADDNGKANGFTLHEKSRRGWPIDLTALKHPPLWVASIVTTLCIIVAIALTGLSAIAMVRLALDLIGEDKQRASDAVKSLLPIAAAAIGLPLIIWRLVILSRQTTISEAKTQIDRETHYTSIFSRSVEQLGQTRELKESRGGTGSTEATTKTVPNIEVRLGGIHSLVRLSEESDRDVEKIENTLLSYVRENSWSDRGGISYTALEDPYFGSRRWASSYRLKDLSDKAAEELAEWLDKNKKYSEDQMKWSKDVPETRVDVNEAIDALASISAKGRTEGTSRRFYECLFVGRAFRTDLLGSYDFDRCTFVRCDFIGNEVNELNIRNSRFIGGFARLTSSKARFYNCYLNDLYFIAIPNCQIEMSSCNSVSISFDGSNGAKLIFNNTNLNSAWFESDNELNISARNTVFPYTYFTGVTFSRDSLLENCAFPDAHFTSADLSAVTYKSREALFHANADALTRLPKDLLRPESWPPFDRE